MISLCDAQAVALDMALEPVGDDSAERLALGSNAGRPARTRWIASRASSRAASMVIRSVGPRVVQTCLPSGVRVTVANDWRRSG